MYIRETIGSFFLFFAVIGPVAYKAYFQNQTADNSPDRLAQGPTAAEEEDSYVTMVKKYKRKQAELKGEPQEEEQTITFADYEQFVERLEKDGRIDLAKE